MTDPYNRTGFRPPRAATGADRNTPHERLHAKSPMPPKPQGFKAPRFKPHDQDTAAAPTPEAPPIGQGAVPGSTPPDAGGPDDDQEDGT